MLQSPTSGDYKSSITIFESRVDNSKYAIVFYKNEVQQITDKSSLRMGILNKTENEDWRCVWDIPCEGEIVDQILFTEDKDNIYLIAGYASSKNIQNKYCIYNLSAKHFKVIYIGEYNLMKLFDINSDGVDELITIGNYDRDSIDTQKYSVTNNISNSRNVAKAVINSISNNHITLWGDTEMLSYSQKQIKASIDKITFGKPSLFIDNQISEYFYSTEILTFEKDRLKNITLKNKDEFTSRDLAPFSYDINDDGEIEVPTVRTFPGYNKFIISENLFHIPFITTWHKYKNNKMVKVFDTYTDYTNGFGFVLPENWQNKVSASQISEDEVEFFIFNNSIKNNSEKLFKIKIDYQKNRNNISPDYFILKSRGAFLYLVNFNENIKSSRPEFSISLEDLKNRFFIISDK